MKLFKYSIVLFLILCLFSCYNLPVSAGIRKGSNLKYSHIFSGTKPIKRIYKGSSLIYQNESPPNITSFSVFPNNVDLDLSDNEKTSSITFNRRNTGNFWAIPSRSEGSVSGFTGLVTANHCYIGQTICRVGGIPNNVHFYIFSIQNTDPNYLNYSSVTINGRTYNLTRATSDFTSPSLGVTTRSYWTTSAINSADTITDSRLTMSIKFNLSSIFNKLRFNFAIGPTVAEVTKAQIYQVRGNIKVGPEHDSTLGGGLIQTIRNIDRPNQTTDYRLLATNGGGASHRDIQFVVTKDATISGCRRTGFNNQTFLYQFTATVTGLPRPVVTYSFSGGRTGTIDARHFQQGSNPYTWTITNWRVNFANANPQSLTLTANNSSSTNTCRLANINN